MIDPARPRAGEVGELAECICYTWMQVFDAITAKARRCLKAAAVGEMAS